MRMQMRTVFMMYTIYENKQLKIQSKIINLQYLAM